MDLVELINSATSCLATHGNIRVNIESLREDSTYNRKNARCTDIQIQKKGLDELLFVIVGGKDNDFKYE